MRNLTRRGAVGFDAVHVLLSQLQLFAKLVCVSLAALLGISPVLGAHAAAARQDAPQTEVSQRLERPRADALAELPADVDLVLVVNNGAALRASTLGRRAERWLADQGVLERLEPAGKALGSELGWTRDELFDRLLGHRVVLVLRGGPDLGTFRTKPATNTKPQSSNATSDAATRWALVSRVTRADERRLRERLAIAPRAMIDGQQALSLERGTYELASRATLDAENAALSPSSSSIAPASRDQELVEMVLGPVDPALLATEPSLFEQLVRRPEWPENLGAQTLDNQEASSKAFRTPRRLAETRAFDCAAAFPKADLVVMWRVREPGAPRANERADWNRFFVLSAWREELENSDAADERWTIRTTYAEPERAAELAAIRGFSLRSFEQLAAGACGAMLQAVSLNDLLTPSLPVADLVRQLQMPEAAAALIGQEQALRLESIPPRADLGQPDRPRLAVGAAVGVKSVTDAAPAFDRALTEFISSIESARGRNAPSARTTSAGGTSGGTSGGTGGSASGGSSGGASGGAGPQSWMPSELAGVAPGAVRVVPVVFAEPRPDVLLAGGALTFSWAYGAQCVPNDFAGPDAAERSKELGNGLLGWWCVGLTPDAETIAPTDARRTRIGEDSRVRSATRLNTNGAVPDATLDVAAEASPETPAAGVVRNLLSAGDADPAGLVRRTLEPLVESRAKCSRAEGGWLWLVSLKPIELERSLPAIWPDYRGIRSAMQGVTSVSARLRTKPGASDLEDPGSSGRGEIEGWATFTLPPMKE